MSEDARNSGFKYLVKEMNKMQVSNDEKGKAPKKEIQDGGKEAKKKVEKKVSAPAKATDNIKDLVKGFFQQANKPKEDKKPVDLFVGRPRKRPTKKAVAAPVEAPKPRAKPRPSRAKKKTSRRRA